MKKYILLIFILFIACNKEMIVDSNHFIYDENITNFDNENCVSLAEAKNISNLFFANLTKKKTQNLITRFSREVNNAKAIKKIEVVYFKEKKKPKMYIMNYEGGGFTIISATKNYSPILAYSENSSVSLNDIQSLNGGLSLWSHEIGTALKQSEYQSEEESYKIQKLWNALETEDLDPINIESSNYTYDQYMRFYQRMSELYTLCPGYSFGPLTSAQSFLSPSEYTALLNIALSYGSPPECTIVGYKHRPVQEVGPLIGTEWSQNNPYNYLIPNSYPAGCVTIAMAQVMKFHEVPHSYNWNNMPTHNATIDTQVLIYDVSQAADVAYGSESSSSTIDKTQVAFDSLGYSTTQKDHEIQDVKYELLINQRPVYMTGFRKVNLIKFKGHAWVCEGARYIDRTVNYFVEYLLSDNSYSSLGGPSWQLPTSSSGWNSLYFYLNWGWGPNHGNGWFTSTDVNSELGNYEYQRENLYIYPN